MATQRKDGRWVARQRTETGRVCGYGKTPQEADADLAEKLRLDNEVISEIPKAPTLHDVAELLWVPRIHQLKPKTISRYESAYKNHIMDSLGSIPVDAITVVMVQNWVNASKHSPKTVKLHVEVLSNIFSSAIQHGLADRSPTRYVTLPELPPKRHRALDIEGALALLDASAETPIGLPVFLSITLGLRLGEVAALKWEDIDRRAGKIEIRRQRQAQKGKGVVETDVKRGHRRTLYIRREHMEAIDRRGDLDSPYVATYCGHPWVPNTIYEKWTEHRVAFGLKDWTFHDLRHLAAGLLYAAGADLLEIAAILGHKKPDMSLTYTSITKRQVTEALGKQPISLFR